MSEPPIRVDALGGVCFLVVAVCGVTLLVGTGLPLPHVVLGAVAFGVVVGATGFAFAVFQSARANRVGRWRASGRALSAAWQLLWDLVP